MYVAILVVVLSASVNVNRLVLFSAVVGAVLIILARKILTGTISGKTVLRIGLLLCVLIIPMFAFFSALRGADTPEAITTDLAAYTISSYNRLAALLSGTLRFSYAGTGVYCLWGFLPFNNLFNRIIPVRELLKWPSYYDLFDSLFSPVWRAHLNGNSVWASTFGYVYADLGWLSPGFLFLYGLVYGWVWRSVQLGRTFGIVLYPWFAFCMLFWFGYTALLETGCAVLVIDSFALSAYDFIFLRRVPSLRALRPSN